MHSPLVQARNSHSSRSAAHSCGALVLVLTLWLGVGAHELHASIRADRPVEPVRIPFAPTVPPGEWNPQPGADAGFAALHLDPVLNAAERQRVISAFAPPVIVDAPVDPEVREAQRRALLTAATEFEAAGDMHAAHFAIERAIGLGDATLEDWRTLGRVRLALRQGPGAAAAYLAALNALPDPEDDAIAFVELRSRVHRDLAKVYLIEERPRELASALAWTVGLARSDEATRHWLIDASIELQSGGPPLPSGPVVWPERPRVDLWTRGIDFVEQQLTEVALLDESTLAPIRSALENEPRRRMIVGASIGLIAFVVLLLLLRQRGDMMVAIEYPDELRGVFRVRVARSAGRWRRGPTPTREEIRKGGASTRFEHHQVNRETHFMRLRARRYYVTVEGMLFDPDTDEVLEDLLEQKMVRVRHRRTVRLEFDVRPEACPVDVHVVWNDKPAVDAAVVAPERRETLVRARDGNVARMLLSEGEHKLVVGCGDRAVERDVTVRSFRPTRVDIDLAGSEVVFKGCPPAVEPYLRGDIDEVAKALERDGQASRGYLLLARMYRERGDLERAADYFESAGELLDAADLRERLDDHVRAATLYMLGERPRRAAEMYELADEWVRAGGAYEEAQDFDSAIECYREAGDIDKWINSLERRGKVFEAAKIALSHDQRPRAIRLLQCIPSEDSNYAEACWQLAEAFERENHWDLASVKLEDHIATFGPGRAPSDKVARLAQLFEQAGNIEKAIDVLEELRRREPTFPNVASRIEHLRKQQSAALQLSTSAGRLSAGAAPTAFVAESRYELVAEIGRGGMGVVYEALDRRLDRVVALKKLPDDLRRHHPRAVQLFLREAQSLAKLNHANIVTVYDTDQEEGAFFITMELLHGEPFNRILKERGQLTSENVVGVGRQVAAGLHYAHARGIVHRDIKTANLFLTTDRVVKIMDFGLAKVFEEVRGHTTVVSGTPFYMSPEQVLGGAIDQRTDLYSLGVTLFELVTGRVPFSQGDIAYHHRHTAPEDPREVVADVDDDLAELILALLSKDPQDRPESAERVLEKLRGIST